MTDKEKKEILDMLADQNKIIAKTNKILAETNENLRKSQALIKANTAKLKKLIEGEKVIVNIKPLEETFGETAIRCGYCDFQHGCPVISFPLYRIQKCCPLQEFPVDLNKIKGKLPKGRLNEFLNNSLQ